MFFLLYQCTVVALKGEVCRDITYIFCVPLLNACNTSNLTIRPKSGYASVSCFVYDVYVTMVITVRALLGIVSARDCN